MLMNLSEPNEQYYRSAFNTEYEKSSTLLLDPQGARKRGDADRVNNNNNNVTPTPQFSLTALLNLRSLASKRPASSSSDLDCGRTDPTIATLLAKRIKTDEDRKKSTHRQGFNGSSSLKLQKTSSQAPSQTGPSINLTISDNDNVQLVRDNIEELIYISKVKHTYVQAHTVPYPNLKKYLSNSSQQGRIKVSFYRAENNCNNLNIIVTNPTGREFGRLLRPVFKLQRYDYYNPQDSNSLTQIQAIDPSFQTNYIYVLRSVDEIQANVADVFDTVVSKSDEVPTRELSSHIKTELYPHQKQALYFMLRNNSRKFYHLVITGEDTHCKQTIKKAYIISPERASLILFIT
ncbi:hypothetical protein HBH50_153450 [Parastagonospora nodorum]|nr:hypothetical protein HBH50_153450 [Parastagonospora nodorum]KAH4079545.1 hypothetical protein HBH48_220240 [Parastagonospora nodorum]